MWTNLCPSNAGSRRGECQPRSLRSQAIVYDTKSAGETLSGNRAKAGAAVHTDTRPEVCIPGPEATRLHIGRRVLGWLAQPGHAPHCPCEGPGHQHGGGQVRHTTLGTEGAWRRQL